MTEIALKFLYNEIEIKMKGKKDDYMKEIFSKYAEKINKNIEDIFFYIMEIKSANKISYKKLMIKIMK